MLVDFLRSASADCGLGRTCIGSGGLWVSGTSGDGTRHFRAVLPARINIVSKRLSPTMFSFNSPAGACRRSGFGNTIDYDLDLVISR